MGQHLTLPVSSGGWNTRDPLDQMPAGDAIIMDNIIHTGGADVVRKGYVQFSNDNSESGTTQYDQMFAYNAGDDSRILAIQGNIVKVFDLTGALMTFQAIGTGNGNFRTAQFTDGSGQIHTLIIRGDNEIWDFSVISGVDTFSQSTFTTSLDVQPNWSGIFSYKNRIYLIEMDSFSIWYGDVQSIGGTLEEFYVGSFFKKSGKILALGNWTQDGGAGPDDQLCIYSDNGEVLIYSGLSPVAEDWRNVGLFSIEKVINDRMISPIKADIILGTTSGYVPQSSILSALSANSVAISSKINSYIKSKNFGSVIWKMEYWSAQGQLIINAPSIEQSLISEFHVLNFENNTWSRFLGQNARDFIIVGGRMFFCREDGIWEDNVGNTDNGMPIKWRKQSAYSDFGIKYKKKVMRWIPRIEAVSIPDLYKYVLVDFTKSAKTWVFDNISGTNDALAAKWDSSKWNLSKWVDLTGNLFSIKTGIAHRPAVYISLGMAGESTSETRMFSTDLVMVIYHGTL